LGGGGVSGWIKPLIGVIITVVLTTVVTTSIFYGVTNFRMEQHDSRIKVLESKHEQLPTTLQSRFDTERGERERVRDAFIQNATKTTELLGQMNAKLAVSETRQEVTNQTLKQIAEQIQRWNSLPAPSSKR